LDSTKACDRAQGEGQMILPISKVLNHGKVRYRVNFGKRLNGDGTYRRKYFKSIRAARKYIKEVLGQQNDASRQFLSLAPGKQLELINLHRLIEAKGISLETAQDIFSRIASTKDGAELLAGASLKVAAAVKEFLDNRRAHNLEKETIREYRSQLSRFAEKFGDQELAGLQKMELQAWIDAMAVGERTKRNYVTTLRTFFRYWVDEEVISKNPADRVPKPKIKRKRPEILTLEQISPFIQLICKEEPKLIAPMAFSLFAGIRTNEVFKLLWSDVDLVKGLITIPEQAAKGNRERSFKIQSNCGHGWNFARTVQARLISSKAWISTGRCGKNITARPE
jgi:site-specific recombinase XerD